MKSFIIIQVSIIIVLSIIIGFNVEEDILGYFLIPFKMLIVIPFFVFTVIITPIMLVTYNWGLEFYSVVFIVFLFIVSLLFYGWNNKNRLRGKFSISIAIWGYTFISAMFMGSHF